MKYVESWWVEELPNGIYHLLINTTERWIDYYSYTDTEFLIGEHDYEKEDVEAHRSKILTIPKFLPKNESFYIQTSMQEKDQISFYWIPFNKDYIKNRNVILSSDENQIKNNSTTS